MTKVVGVSEAKTHMSRLLDDVIAGEQALITRRGEVVASLVPTGSSAVRKLELIEEVSQFQRTSTRRSQLSS